MPKVEKTLQGDIEDINKKLAHAICSNCALTTECGTWTTTAGDVKCIFTVFEKHAKKIWNKTEGKWKDQPHYVLSLTLIDTGEEVRLCAITSGSGQGTYFIPDAGPEGELMDVLNTALNVLDKIIVE